MGKQWQFFFLGVAIVSPLLCMAQEDASRIEKRFERPPEPKASPQSLVFPIKEALPPEKAQEIRLTLTKLVIKGNTAFSADQLAPLYANLIGKSVTLLDIYNIRDAITAKYGNAGFGLSKAVIPEQRIQTDGLVRRNHHAARFLGLCGRENQGGTPPQCPHLGAVPDAGQ